MHGLGAGSSLPRTCCIATWARARASTRARARVSIEEIYYGIVKPRVKQTRDEFLIAHVPQCQQFDILVDSSDPKNFLVLNVVMAMLTSMVHGFRWSHILSSGRLSHTAQFLLSYGMDPNHMDAAGETMLSSACMIGGGARVTGESSPAEWGRSVPG